VLLAACLLAAALPSGAQPAPRDRAADGAAAARARIDSLLPLLEQATAAGQRRRLQERQAELAAAGKLDTVAVGPLLVVGRGRALDDAVPLVRAAWAEYEPLLGGAAGRLEGVSLLVQRDRHAALVGELARRPRHYRIRFQSSVPQPGDDPDLLVRGALNAAVFALLPGSVQRWLGDGNVAGALQHARTYRELVLRNSIGAERCLRRDVDACAALLGVADAGSDWAAWYTREQLQALARDRRLGVGGGEYDRCVAAGDACVAAFASAGGPPPPLGQHARASFLQHILPQGGAGSLERLVADSAADARTALTRASGGPLDSAIAAWQQAVSRARPEAYADLGRSLLVTIVWCGLLLTLALRSTRWRIG
jgi:hypothetical protein